jgi:hypothetical protein
LGNFDYINFILVAIGNVGFPIVLTGYLLFRFEGKIERLNDTMREMIRVIQVIQNDIRSRQ